MIPDLTDAGVLPEGVHPADWDELTRAFGFNDRRRVLLSGLRAACIALAAAGCDRVWVDGSFVTDKAQPGDYDMCWGWQAVEEALLDPVLLDYSPPGRAAIQAKYLGDVLIAGIETASGLPFVEFFQQHREGGKKGIVLIDPREV